MWMQERALWWDISFIWSARLTRNKWRNLSMKLRRLASRLSCMPGSWMKQGKRGAPSVICFALRLVENARMWWSSTLMGEQSLLWQQLAIKWSKKGRGYAAIDAREHFSPEFWRSVASVTAPLLTYWREQSSYDKAALGCDSRKNSVFVFLCVCRALVCASGSVKCFAIERGDSGAQAVRWRSPAYGRDQNILR